MPSCPARICIALSACVLALTAAGQIVVAPPSPLTDIAQSDTNADTDPAIATGPNGVIIVVWVSYEDISGDSGADRDLYYVRSTDSGVSWSDPELFNLNGATDTADDIQPLIAADNTGNWTVAWIVSGSELSNANDTDILYAHSGDNGVTWTAPALLNTGGLNDDRADVNVGLASGAGGNWLAVWEYYDDLGGTIGTEPDIVVARSADGGATWAAPTVVNNNADTDDTYDLTPTIASDGAGTWMAAWASNIDSNLDNDIYTATSTNNGQTWTDPQRVNGNASLPYTFDSEPVLATDGDGTWLCAWRASSEFNKQLEDGRDIAVSRSSNDGQSWSEFKYIVAQDTLREVSVELSYDPAGSWIAAFSATPLYPLKQGIPNLDGDVFITQSFDAGATWPQYVALNDAENDTGGDGQLKITYTGENTYVSVWSSSEAIGGSGTDQDIITGEFVVPDTGGNTADINSDGNVDAVDVQLAINAALGISINPYDADVNGDSSIDAVDIQVVINAALGLT